jgi:hypothetical protein
MPQLLRIDIGGLAITEQTVIAPGDPRTLLEDNHHFWQVAEGTSGGGRLLISNSTFKLLLS